MTTEQFSKNLSPAAEDERFLYGVSEGIATISINRANKLNALLPDMILAFSDILERARRDPEVRAIVLRGEGRAFCAGDDLAPEDRFKYGPPDMHTRLKMGYPRLVNDILQMRKPVIAMVQGYAVGAGFDLALACDFRIVSPETKMAAIFVKRGLGGGCSYLLPRYVGMGKATEMLLLGDMVEMEEAKALSLVTKVVEPADLEAETYALAARLAAGATQAIGAIKNARNQGLGCDPVKGLEW
ncbi:enoyl-CoA hydratase/isomerase family protein, partial [Alloyangia pacifica]